jgi:hypothetical protein
MLDAVRRIEHELDDLSGKAVTGEGNASGDNADALCIAHSAALSLIDAIIDALGSD